MHRYHNKLDRCKSPSRCDSNVISKEIKKAYRIYTETYNSTFYYTGSNAVEKLNNLDEVSLEGSRRVEMLRIKNGRYVDEILMPPQSVVLMIISK